MLAGGVAAAVAAIVAAVSIGNRSGAGPAADANPIPDKVAVVQSTGTDGTPTVVTVTAPVSTVNGTLFALVPDASGRLQRLPVVTAPLPPVASTGSPSTTPAPSSSSSVQGGVVTVASTSSRATATTTPTPAATSSPRATSTRSTGPAATPSRTAASAPADPGDVATVITGLTKLTGWVPLTTG